MRPKRSLLGQIFLSDKNYIKKIINVLDIDGEKVLEIGSGKGQLSQYLVLRAKKLYCLEIDRNFCDFLTEKFAGERKVKIIRADILKFPVSKLGENLTISGNVPYQISSKLIAYLISNRRYIKKAYLTFQREFAAKLLARPSSAHYGYLSCYSQYYATITKLFKIPAGAFRPQPKVDSVLIEIDFHQDAAERARNEQFLFELIRKAFAQRRKKLINVLPIADRKKDVPTVLKLNPNARPADFSLNQYVSLANELFK